jgi:hypothetical protein
MRTLAEKPKAPRQAAPPRSKGPQGMPLDSKTRAHLEKRFEHNFSKVRIHADTAAAESASALGARAYTLGTDVSFGAGQYAPTTRRGGALLAHELAHVVQQEGATFEPGQTPVLGSESDPSERNADAAVRAAISPHRSTALNIRAQLRATAPRVATVQRAVATWGGEFETTKYNLLAMPGFDGVEIDLEFRPNDKVDAEKIGMVQSVLSSEKGAPVLIGTPAEQAVYKQRAVAPGKTGAGRQIDQLAMADFANPLYATGVAGAADRLRTTPTGAGWGHHGWRYTDKAGKVQTKNALLKDKAKLSSARKESAQKFETTALAVQGVQEGTYYGSVSWGWEKNVAGVVAKLPLTRVSKDAPSDTFTNAARKWNTSKILGGRSTIDLPIVTRGYATADGTVVVVDPTAPAAELCRLTKNTRVEVTNRARTAAFNVGAATPWWKVTIADGPNVGKVGWLRSTTIATDPLP